MLSKDPQSCTQSATEPAKGRLISKGCKRSSILFSSSYLCSACWYFCETHIRNMMEGTLTEDAAMCLLGGKACLSSVRAALAETSSTVICAKGRLIVPIFLLRSCSVTRDLVSTSTIPAIAVAVPVKSIHHAMPLYWSGLGGCCEYTQSHILGDTILKGPRQNPSLQSSMIRRDEE